MTTDNSFQVLILGYGEMGHAMEQLLHRHALTVWERHPKSGAPPIDLESVAARQDFVLFCLPSSPHFDLAIRLRPRLRRDCLCLSIAKGLDERGRTSAQALNDAFGSGDVFAVMYGPMISEELRAGRPGFAQVGATRAGAYESIRRLFAGTPLYLEHTADVTGISWSAVLKNVYALLFGVADELQLGDNMRGYLAATVLDELTRIVTGFGGSAETARRLAGLGDLITTATSAGSHHRELGRRLARGGTETLEGEGVHTLKMIRVHGLFGSTHHPLFDLVGRLLAEPATTRAQMQDFLDHMRG